MSVYIFKYFVQLAPDEISYLGDLNIQQRIEDTGRAGQIFHSLGVRNPDTENVFVVRANSYKEVMQLISSHRMILHSAYGCNTLGNWDGEIRNYVANNKLHILSCKYDYFTDAVACYKISEADKGRIYGLYDAMRYAESCMESFGRTIDLNKFRANLVY